MGGKSGAPAQFEAFSSQVTLSARELRRAKELLADIVANTSQATNDAVTQFNAGYQALLQRWDTFHKQYDQWRSTEGGCDRAEAAQTLGGFAIRSGDLAATARSLPPLTLLRPLVELLVEAVEREEEALRQLRNTWVPFDVTVYAIYDSQRSEASGLRRQVASGLASLLANHGISAEEIPNRSSE